MGCGAIVIAAAGCLLARPAAAGADEQGFAEARVGLFDGVPGASWQTVERLRPTFAAAPADGVKAVATIEAGLRQGRDRSALRTAADYLDVDRLFLDAYGQRADLRLGRQALHWGSAQFFNPTDPFPEILLTEPWRPRRGVNAARAFWAPAERADLTAVGLLDDALAHPQAALRARGNAAGTDAALVGAWRGGSDWLAGADLKGTLGVGWWVEAARRSGADGVQAAVGADYSFPVLEGVVSMVQYQRDAPLPAGLDRNLRDTALASVAVMATPDLTLTAAALAGLDTWAGVALPSASWALLDWLEVAASAAAVFGRSGPAVVTVWTRASF